MALSEVERRLGGMIAAREAALLDDLAEHVRIPTGRGHRPGLTSYREMLIGRLERLGGKVRVAPGDPRPGWLEPESGGGSEGEEVPIVIAEHGGEPGLRATIQRPESRGSRVLIAAHMDTVHDPAGSFQELTMLDEESGPGRATGPGAADMKGGIVIALAALEALREAGIDLRWTMLLNSDEETGSFRSMRILREVAAEHDIGIAVEPALADGSLAIERMGSGQFMIEVRGRSAHVGREFERGVSAVTRLGEILLALSQMADPAKGRIVNVGPLQGGEVTNAVPDYAACWGNARFISAEAGEELGRMIDALANQEDALPRVIVHRRWNRPAKPAIPAVRALAEAAVAAAGDLGQSLPLASTGGVCDGNILQDAGLPTIDTLGVRGGNLHREDEFIEVASLVERCQLLAVLLARLSRGERAVDC